MFGLGVTEMVVVGIVAVLLFGSRLPSVARSLGKSMVEFKKGMHGVEEELNSAVYSPPPRTTQDKASQDNVSQSGGVADHDEESAHRFEPPTGEPRQEAAESESS